jgi:8-oxo-dGTP diphosphatase
VIRARTGRPPAAEIEEIIWIEAASVPDILIAPLTRDHILPLHRRAGRA